jgi:hypothetical protein
MAGDALMVRWNSGAYQVLDRLNKCETKWGMLEACAGLQSRQAGRRTQEVLAKMAEVFAPTS